MVYKLELLIVAAIFIIAGVIMAWSGFDPSAKGIDLSTVLIVIGIIFVILWAILYAIVHIVHR